MFKSLLAFAFLTLSVGKFIRPLVFQPYPGNGFHFSPLIFNYGQRALNMQMCTYSEISYRKCIYTVAAARNNSIPLALDCMRRNSRKDCINSVQKGIADLLVLTGHGYKEARATGLRPVLFAKESDESLYIAVAPRNITFVDVQEAPIYFDHSNERAFHAATYFNLHMGHNICSFLNKVSAGSYISIVDSATYNSSSEEILICPTRVPAEFSNYKNCNIEASLQRAVFVRSDMTSEREQKLFEIFETITEHFNTKSGIFKFLDTFQGQDDVIFKKNTISFDVIPSYRNDVDEEAFNELHCHEDDQRHDPRVLL